MNLLALSAALLVAPLASAAETRPLRVDDIFALREVADPRLSPEGQWVAYTVKRLDAKEDAADIDVYMSPFGGGEAVRLTMSRKSDARPRWSPDGRYLAFLSDREGTKDETTKKKTQVYLMSRAGGEAVQLTEYKASVSDLAWSPDSTRLALVVADPDPDDPDLQEEKEGKKKTRRPIVIHRLQFKRDEVGFLRELRDHIHVFDLKTTTSVQVTSGPYDDSEPVWSPDGSWIAFTSNRTGEPDSNRNSDIFVVAPRAGEAPRALTTSAGEDLSPAWSPDGTLVAYLAGGDPKDMWYAPHHVAVVPVNGGPPRPLTAALDRDPSQPRFSADGRSVLFLLEEEGNRHLARVPLAGGPVARVVDGERDVSGFDVDAKGDLVVLESEPQRPPEVFAVAAGGTLRRVTRVNDAFLAGIRLGKVERHRVTGTDGTTIDWFLTLPPDAPEGRKLPAILRIHGGPVGQFSTAFDLEWQILAARGYAVLGANPRGSSGRGLAFSRAIWADWGNRDYRDLMAVVDQSVAMGVADPDRLGVGGWSYGGMMTNYVIAQTGRFKAAIAGAGAGNYVGNYGHDHYQYEYEAELGFPWKTAELWMKLSFPFFKAETITTPTLFLCGELDWNVPLLNSEQMYQALRRLGRETELVVYPGESHSLKKPSYWKDRYERYLAWYGKYLKPGPGGP